MLGGPFIARVRVYLKGVLLAINDLGFKSFALLVTQIL